MAIVIDGGNRAYSALAMAAPDASVAQYCQTLAQNWGQQTMMMADHLKQNTQQFFSNWNYDGMLRTVQAAAGMLTHAWRPDVPMYLPTLSAIQNAPPVMMNNIMVHPGLFKLHEMGMIEGYENRYQNPDPHTPHEWHMDWQRMMDGVWVSNEKECYHHNYLSTVTVDLEEQTPQAIFAALRTFDKIDAILAECEDDPTSRWNNPRG